MERIYNFSAGPAMLPEAVLQKAAEEMMNYKNTGMSVMEMSHRSKAFISIMENAEASLRKLMGVPENYSILFLQGGASQQFAMVPMNLMTTNKKADYINTGSWSKKAMKEAKIFGQVNEIASSEDKNFTYIPEEFTISSDADYVHITTNNTIEGTVFTSIPDMGDIPLVADMSSNITSEVIDVSQFGLIYAGAQKNLGPSGVTIVIIRNDLIGKHAANTPAIFQYEIHAGSASMYNTPPTYAIYVAGLVFEWIESLGGIKVMEEMNRSKAAMLYDYIDNSKIFSSPVEPKYRSLMNVPFTCPDDTLNAKFIADAEKNGLSTLAGHRSVGGMRASIYNAMPLDGVKKLISFMKDFEANNL